MHCTNPSEHMRMDVKQVEIRSGISDLVCTELTGLEDYLIHDIFLYVQFNTSYITIFYDLMQDLDSIE